MKRIGLIIVFVIILFSGSLVYGDLVKLPQFSNSKKEHVKVDTMHKGELPDKGLHTYFEMSQEELIARIGEPNRIDTTPYGYQWWIYNENPNQYTQLGMDQGKVVTAIALGKGVNVAPLKIGKKMDNITKKNLNVQKKVDVKVEQNEYQFTLKNEELQKRPLVKLNNLWAQLYIDKFDNTLVGIRYMTPEVLILQRPYSLRYRDELLDLPTLTREDWAQVEEAEALQIFNITNVLRNRYDVSPVQWHEETAKVAYHHSKEMKEKNYFSHTSQYSGDLSKRLENINYIRAGENIAANHIDGIAAVFGWLNSPGHRKALLSKNYTHLGVGVYEKYYTQNFIRPR